MGVVNRCIAAKWSVWTPGSLQLTCITALDLICTHWTICITALTSISIGPLTVKDRDTTGTVLVPHSQLRYSYFSIPCYLVMSIERSHHIANSPPDIDISHRYMYLDQSILVHLSSCTRDNRWLAYTSYITPCYISMLTSIISYTYYTESEVSHQTVQ